MANEFSANRQWASRPDDQRYLSISGLHDAVSARHSHSIEPIVSYKALGVALRAPDDDRLHVVDSTDAYAELTHYAFGQLCTAAGAPVRYLRALPAPIAAINLKYGLEYHAEGNTKTLLTPPNANGYTVPGEFRAFTSATYGRIWDDQVTGALMELDEHTEGAWQIPAASYAARDPKRASTLYASDHDVWVFLVDPEHPIEVAGETLFRGFMVWNSEVGDATFGLRTFLHEYVCDNRIIWGIQDVSEIRIRHTLHGPARFAVEAAPALREYAESSTERLVEGVKAAKAFQLPGAKEPKDVTEWLIARDFGKEASSVAVTLAEHETDDPTNLWNIVYGLTAYARSIPHTDTRVAFERKASALLDMAVK